MLPELLEGYRPRTVRIELREQRLGVLGGQGGESILWGRFVRGGFFLGRLNVTGRCVSVAIGSIRSLGFLAHCYRRVVITLRPVPLHSRVHSVTRNLLADMKKNSEMKDILI